MSLTFKMSIKNVVHVRTHTGNIISNSHFVSLPPQENEDKTSHHRKVAGQ